MEAPSVLFRVIKAVSIPSSTSTRSKRRLAFSIFYAAANSFPFPTSVVYWLALFTSEPLEDHGITIDVVFLRYWVTVNVSAVNSGIAFVEIILLSSVREQKVITPCFIFVPKLTFPQQRLYAHISGIFMITILYAFWHQLGSVVCHQYVYPQLDPRYAGWRALVACHLALLSYALTAFLFQRGMHALRERMTSKADSHRRHG